MKGWVGISLLVLMVVGGEEAPERAYPWLVAVLRTADEAPSADDLICAGTAVGEDWVLTAAHCLFGQDGFPFHPRQVRILADSDTLSGPGRLIEVERIRIHPGFEFSVNQVRSDIALLKLQSDAGLTPVEWSREASQVEMRVGEDARVAGWGARSADPEAPDFPDRLHQAEVPILSAAECAAAYQSAGISLGAEHLCAGREEGGVDFCSRDGGAPLFASDGQGGWLQLALASFGGGACGDADLPGVYTRTDGFAGWIEQTMQQTLYFAQFGNGGTISSDIVLVNPSASQGLSGEVLLLDQNGAPINAASVFPAATVRSGTVSGTAFTLQPSGAVTFSSSGEGDLVQGSAVVFSDQPVEGVIRFRIVNAGIAGVGSSRPLTEVLVPARNREGIRTGLAIRNTGGAPVRVDLSLKSNDGSLLPGALKAETIPADGRLAAFIDEIFLDADLEGFEGTLTARAQDGLIAAIALELGTQPGEFTTLPVVVIE